MFILSFYILFFAYARVRLMMMCVTSGCLHHHHLLHIADKHWPAVCVWYWVNFTSGSTKANSPDTLFLPLGFSYTRVEWKISRCAERKGTICKCESTHTISWKQVLVSIQSCWNQTVIPKYTMLYLSNVFIYLAFIKKNS